MYRVVRVDPTGLVNKVDCESRVGAGDAKAGDQTCRCRPRDRYRDHLLAEQS